MKYIVSLYFISTDKFHRTGNKQIKTFSLDVMHAMYVQVNQVHK